MTANLINNDAICDLQGQPLHAKSATLLKALDKLLTVGAYYSSGHTQYLQAAMKARDEIVGVIDGATNHVAIEITAQGLMVGRQNLDPHHRNVRLLHELLVPLNIARLEIDGTLSPEDLRQALSALQEHKQSLGQSNSFQEIVIHNLPDSVRAVSCTVLHKADDSEDELSLDELLGKWGDEDAAQTEPLGETQSELLAREFMEMVTQILENLDELEREFGVQPQNEQDGSYVTKADLVNLKTALQRLVEVNPDPAELAKLIAQAQQALDLSRDRRSVDLVFQILKKNTSQDDGKKTEKKGRETKPVKYKMSVEELLGVVSKLENTEATIAEPVSGSQSNQLGISLHLLRSDPPRALRNTMVDVVQQATADPGFATSSLALCAQAAATVAREDGAEGLDDLLPLITSSVRRKRPDLMARFWGLLLKSGGEDHLVELWPHLVNDLLLGFDKAPRDMVLPLVMKAGSLSLREVKMLGRRLEIQPALQTDSATRDIFLAPLTSTHALLAALYLTPLKPWLGLELFRALQETPVSPRVDVVMAALAEHDPRNTGLYLDMIRHGAEQCLPDIVKRPMAEPIISALNTAASRQAQWVPQGLTELAQLAPELARPVLERVISERKFIFFKAWSSAARQAAEQALTADVQEVN